MQARSASAACLAASKVMTPDEGSSGPGNGRGPCETSHAHSHPAAGLSMARRSSFISESWPRQSLRREFAPLCSKSSIVRAWRQCAAQCNADQPSTSQRALMSAWWSSNDWHIGRSPVLVASTIGGSPERGSSADGFALSCRKNISHIATSPLVTASKNSSEVASKSFKTARWSPSVTSLISLGISPWPSSSTARSASSVRACASRRTAWSSVARDASKSRCSCETRSTSPLRRNFSSTWHTAASSNVSIKAVTAGAAKSQGRAPRVKCASPPVARLSMVSHAFNAFKSSLPSPSPASPNARTVTKRSFAFRRSFVVRSRQLASMLATRPAHLKLGQDFRTTFSPRDTIRAKAFSRSA
mmetsp:Transcript_947/g.2373  ORF Transcript_947/g.2373 Transcript_947/m.2373 type:complete len:358 (+) Transcript_947:637-1710(+)